MKDNNVNIENINENISESVNETEPKTKKKQKAPLGIRPDDIVEERFKDEANKKGLSQTQMFERIFTDYLLNASQEYKNRNLDCNLEIEGIKGAAETLVKSMMTIISKSQYSLEMKNKELESMRDNVNKKVEIATIDLNTRISELEIENKELQNELVNANGIITGFNTVKDSLDRRITELSVNSDAKDTEISSLKALIKERDKAIKSLERDIDNAAKGIYNIEKEVALLKDEKINIEGKLASAQANAQMLQDTLHTFNTIKATEIQAIKDNADSMLQLKIESLETRKNIEIDTLKNTISSLEAKLKNALEVNSSLEERNKMLTETNRMDKK